MPGRNQRTSGRWVPIAAAAAILAGAVGAGAAAVPAWATGSLTATFAHTSIWGTGYVGRYTLANTGTSLHGWTLSFDLAAGQSMTSSWNGTVRHTGQHYVVTNATWDGTLSTGGQATFGFQASYSGTFAAPANCLVNGTPCAGTTSSSTTTTTAPPATTTTTTAPPATTTTTAPPSGGTGGGGTLSATFTRTSDWGDGYVADYAVDDTGAPITSWTLEFTLPQTETITSAWSGNVTHVGTTYTVTNASWNGEVGTGGSATVGFQGGYSGAFVAPEHCTVNGQPCAPGGAAGSSGGGSSGGAGTGTPTATGNGTGTATTTTPLPPLPAGTAFSFAPYVDTTVDTPPFDLAAADAASGTRYFSLGFVVSGGGCQASWGGYYPTSSGYYATRIQALRAAGGDVTVSFGGEAGQSLLEACTSVSSLENQYQSVVTDYGLSHIDFDIEGAAQGDTAALDRNFQAVALLEAADPDLSVSLTLPVLPTGLTSYGLGVVRAAIAEGARIDLVNVMAMDYGAGAAPDPTGNMGTYAIDAAQATHAQLEGLYPSLTSSQVWGMVGVTPMLGVNDTPSEVFDLAAATQLETFATQVHLGRLSMWAATRDVECPGGATGYASDTCSGIVQQPDAFSSVLSAYSG